MQPKMEELLPHRPPMLMIDQILEAGADRLVAEKVFHPSDYGVAEGGVLPGALIEATAQAVAAMQGLAAASRGVRPGAGMLVGVEELKLLSTIVLGQPLKIVVVITRRLSPFVMADAEVFQDGVLLVQGGLKFFLEGDPLEA